MYSLRESRHLDTFYTFKRLLRDRTSERFPEPVYSPDKDNNIILVNNPYSERTYTRHSNPNILRVEDKSLCIVSQNNIVSNIIIGHSCA